MGLDLDKIKQRLLDANKKGGSDVFWKISDGQSVVRIVPPKDGDPFVEAFQHYNVGKNAPFLCPRKQFNKPCPVCELASKLWKSKDNQEDIALAKKLSVKARYFSPVLVRGEEDKKVRWWSYSKTVYVKLLKVVANQEEYGDITSPEIGTDLVIDYGTVPGALYPKTDFEVKRKSSPLCKDMTKEKCQELFDSIPDITKGLNQKTTEEIEKMLNEWLLSGEEEQGADITKDVEKYGNKSAEEKKVEGEANSIDAAFEELLQN